MQWTGEDTGGSRNCPLTTRVLLYQISRRWFLLAAPEQGSDGGGGVLDLCPVLRPRDTETYSTGVAIERVTIR